MKLILFFIIAFFVIGFIDMYLDDTDWEKLNNEEDDGFFPEP